MNARTALLPAMAALGLASAARADVITWGAPQDVLAPSDVRTNGTLVTARNCNASSPVYSPTVGGVTFAAFAPSGWTNASTSALNGSTTGDMGYDQLLGAARATGETTLTNPSNWGGIRLDTLGTLVQGKTYEIQIWFCDQRPGGGTTAVNDRRMSFSSAVGVATLTSGNVTNLGSLTQGPISLGLDADPNNFSGAGDTIFGQHIVGTFTRSSTSPLYLIEQGSHPVATNTLRPHITAFQIREVPPIVVTPYCTAGTTTNGCVPAISANGTASVAASSGFTLVVSNVEGQKQGLIFYGISGRAASAWGVGGTSFLCVKSPTQRMAAQDTGGTAGSCDGTLSRDWLAFLSATPTALGAPFSAGAIVQAQGWFRDPPAPKTTNLSNALEFTLVP